MHAASRTLLVAIGLAAASAACRQPSSDENVTIDHHDATTTDIESLPPDESVATPTDELVNGDDEPSNSDEQSNTGAAQH
jgi:hypothetical protein